MKKTKLSLALLAVLAISPYAHSLELKIVADYNKAEASEVWKKAKSDRVPEALLEIENVANPRASYSSLFPKSFLQDDEFAVCFQDCDGKEAFRLRNGEFTDLDDRDVIEQANVYFWLNRYFSFLENDLMFRPQKFLKVMTNRIVKQEGKKLTNNAFFNPEDTTLSFLPASNNLLFKLLMGKLNRSGYDPSVIGHETSHFLFQHLFPNPVNDEIGGLNEGFADYISNAFLNNPKVGLIMLQGKPLRDSSSPVTGNKKIKSYEPNLEVHDLGERAAYALWSTRELSQNKNEFDRMVIDAVAELGQNPYSAIHDFKEIMQKRLPSIIDQTKLSNANAIWEMVFPGSRSVVPSTDFLNAPIASKSYSAYSIRQVIPKETAKEMNVPQEMKLNFNILKTIELSANERAILFAIESETLTTPYWIVIDTSRSTIQAIYTIDHKLVTDEKELEVAKKVADQAAKSNDFIKDFNQKLETYSQLANGQGELSRVFKVKGKKISDEDLKFNDSPVSGQKIELRLGRKLFMRILGAPDIETLTLHTVPMKGVSKTELNGQSVIGYTITLGSGTTMEIILSKFSK